MSHSKSILLSLTLLLADFLINSNSNFIEAPFFTNAPQCKEPKNRSVHIAMTLDEAYLRGSMAAILSIIHHSTCPENLHFHFIYSQNNEDQETHLKSIISHSFSYLPFNMYPFDEEIVKGRISTSLREALDRPLNYARSYLASMFPEWVHRVVYLDSDVILVDDIGELYKTEFVDDESVIAAPEYCDTDFSRYFTSSFWSNPMLALTFENRRSKACYFNTGVMVVDLKRWREKDYTNSIEEWMELQKRVRIYELGSLPPFLLVFAGDVTPVEPKWNQHGLGGDNYEGHCRWLHPGPTSLMHWSGRGKPWVRLDQGRPCPIDASWAPFDMFIKTYSESLHV